MMYLKSNLRKFYSTVRCQCSAFDGIENRPEVGVFKFVHLWNVPVFLFFWAVSDRRAKAGKGASSRSETINGNKRSARSFSERCSGVGVSASTNERGPTAPPATWRPSRFFLSAVGLFSPQLTFRLSHTRPRPHILINYFTWSSSTTIATRKHSRLIFARFPRRGWPI